MDIDSKIVDVKLGSPFKNPDSDIGENHTKIMRKTFNRQMRNSNGAAEHQHLIEPEIAALNKPRRQTFAQT